MHPEKPLEYCIHTELLWSINSWFRWLDKFSLQNHVSWSLNPPGILEVCTYLQTRPRRLVELRPCKYKLFHLQSCVIYSSLWSWLKCGCIFFCLRRWKLEKFITIFWGLSVKIFWQYRMNYYCFAGFFSLRKCKHFAYWG